MNQPEGVKTAMVVDDSAAMRVIVKRALEGSGWDVRIAGNGVEALRGLEEMVTCQLIITDWHMPEMDGLEFVKNVRKQERFVDTPILMVTTEGVLESVQAALSAGVTDFHY